MIYLILALAFVLRFVALNQSLWLDEAVQAWASSRFSLAGLIKDYLPGDFNPPLYHLLMWFWVRVFGTSEVALRLPSVFFGVATVWLVYKICQTSEVKETPTSEVDSGLDFGMSHPRGESRIKSGIVPVYTGTPPRGWRALNLSSALLPALLLATSPLHLYYSQEARMYSLAAFTVTFAFWRFLLWRQKPGRANSFWLALGLLVSVYAHFLTLFTLPLYWLFTNRRDWRRLLLVFLPLLAIGALYAPLFIKQLATGTGWQAAFPVWGQTVGAFTLKAAALLPVKFVIGRISFANPLVYALIGGGAAMVFWGLVGVGLIRLINPPRGKASFGSTQDRFAHPRGERSQEAMISPRRWLALPERQRGEPNGLLRGGTAGMVLVFLLFPPLAGFALSFFVPVFAYFRFLFCLPFFYLAVAYGFSKIRHIRVRKILFIYLIGANIVFSGLYLFNQEHHREDWRGLVGWLHAQPSAPVLLLPQTGKAFEYYDQEKSELNLLPLTDQFPSQNAKIWLVEYSLPIFDPGGEIKSGLVSSGYILVSEKAFRGIGNVSSWERVDRQPFQI